MRTGDPLIAFDLDFLAINAKSLISPVVVTNGDAFAIVRRSIGREALLGEFLMELRPLAEQSAAAAPIEATREIVVRLAHGIHARPAAQVSTAARGFASEIELSARARRVNAKSIAALMSLGVARDERVVIAARGPRRASRRRGARRTDRTRHRGSARPPAAAGTRRRAAGGPIFRPTRCAASAARPAS